MRRQKTNARDAEQLLRLLEGGEFPAIWVPSARERDLRQLVIHRHKLVGLRTRIKNQLQDVALNEGLQKKRQLCTKPGRQWLEPLPLWTARRRADLLQLRDGLEEKVPELDRAVTGLAFVLVVGDVARFRRSKNLTSYLGLIPREESSGSCRRLGAISKPGNTLLRTLLVEAASGWQFLRKRNGASERLSRACALVCP